LKNPFPGIGERIFYFGTICHLSSPWIYFRV